MNAFSKLKKIVLLAGAVLLSAPPASAEDIEIYLYQNEGSGANILLLIDNSGATNRNFPGTSSIPAAEAPSPVKTIDEIAYALRQTIPALSGNTRLGVAAQLSGGDNGGAIYYPVKQIDETVLPSGYAKVISTDGEAGQVFNLGGATLPQPTTAGTWGPIDITSVTLPFPSMMSSNQDKNVLAVTLTGLGVPRWAQVDSAILSFTTPDTSSRKMEALVAYEVNSTPTAPTDLSGLTWDQELDTGYNALAVIDQNIIRVDVTKAVQSAIADPMWCGNQDLRLLIMSSDLPDANAPKIYTQRAEDAAGARLGKTELNVKWSATGEVTPPTGLSADLRMSCVNDVTLTLGGRNDDATETSAGNNLQLTEEELLLQNVTSGPSSERGNYIAGARFSNLAFGQGTKVSNAMLSGTITTVTGGSPQLTVSGLLADVGEFTANGDISKHPKGTQTATLSPAVGDFSVDVTNVLNEVFSDASWASNNSLGLRLDRTGGTAIGIHSVDAGATSGLRITMDVLTNSPKEFGASFDRRSDMKLAVDQFSNNTGGGNNKPTSSYVEAAEYMLGQDAVFGKAFSHIDSFEVPRTNYLSPSEEYNSCGGNHIIMVTHAESSGESFASQVKELVAGNPLGQDSEGNDISCTGDSNSDAWNCAEALSAYLKLEDITTHSIAFAPQKQETIDGLRAVAEASGGIAQETANAEELAKVLSDLINSLTTTDASMAAPGVAVNQLNRFSHLDQLYYALFRPSFQTRWDGNLKRYAVDFTSKQIVDETSAEAVDTDGFFKDTASSWWSNVVDGGDVTKGGSRAQTAANANRKLLTSRTSPAPSGNNNTTTSVTGQSLDTLSTINDVSKAELGLPATATDTDVQEHLDFLLTSWGDPLHSEPRLVNYGYTGTFEEAAADASKQDNVVFVSTNDGMLHAIDPESGDEYFAYIPGEEMAKTASRYDPIDLDAADPRRSTYGLDGGITIWRRSNSTDPSQNPEHVFLYLAQRRGGNAYYAVDATDKTTPKLLWKIDSTQAEFGNLGQTWSTPTLTQISLNGTRVPVLVFGGGYSPDDHDDKTNVSTGDKVGNSIYMVNAFNGKLIWSASSGTNADMKWAIPASVSAVDINFDGLVDHLYAADLGGQIFRIDIDNDGNTGTANLVTRVTTLAKLGTSSASGMDNNRRFYAAPVVALNARSDGNPFLQVGIGSGYRTYPLNQQTSNYIFVVEDYDALNNTSSAAITPSDMVDVTLNTSPSESDFTGNKGWKIELQDSGEKTLSSAVVSSGVMYVTSYLPDSVFQDACNRVVGSSRLYALNVIDGSPALDFNNDGTLDRSTDINLPGLPPSPQVLLDGTNETTLIIGTEALQGGNLNVGKGVRKTRWFQAETEAQAEAALQK
ncbi:pilus assembly protein [Alcanivorax sediminis]|nr:PilC/PilY family type IV pilus protein [Alcanivorax sediminis]